MGHDITAYKLEETAYLRYNAFETLKIKSELYRCLDSMKYYAGASGNGEGRTFTRIQLQDALTKAITTEVKQFLEACINELDDDDEIYIVFS